jgi:hypothetical protein
MDGQLSARADLLRCGTDVPVELLCEL